MKPINPDFLVARSLADHNATRFGDPYLDHPAIARRGKPLPDGAVAPTIAGPRISPEIPGLNWDTAILAVCGAAMVSLLFIEI